MSFSCKWHLSNLLYAIKSIKQYYHPNKELCIMMETFRQMINHCIKLGFENNVTSLKKFSSLFYHHLDCYQIQSKYKLTAMSQACGRLTQMKRSVKKGIRTKSPFISKPYLVSCYGFKINGMLLSIPKSKSEKILILLNKHMVSELSKEGIEARSFIITPNSLSIAVRRKIKEIECNNVVGVDRNLRNVAIYTQSGPVMYKTNKILSIKENTSHVIASFKRFDVRVKKHYQKRLGNRRVRRIQQFLHKISKDIVQRSIESRSMIVLENIKGIRKLYRKGNGQGKRFRRRLNSWSFYELQRQIQYKATWMGIPVRFVDPKHTSQICPVCGDRIQEDRLQLRKLWCTNCKRSMDRDVVAALNISYKGWSRFCHPRGLSSEAVKGNSDNFQPVILRVDGSKLQIQR